MSLLISDAMAAAGSAPAAQTDGTFSLLMIVAIFVLFYFMLIRPQNKRAKEHRDLIGGLKKGDEIITSGGIVGKIVAINESYVRISAAENIEITLQKASISTVLPKNTIKSLF